jgi:hypothetical protein
MLLWGAANASMLGEGHPKNPVIHRRTAGFNMKSSLGPGLVSIPVAVSKVPCLEHPRRLPFGGVVLCTGVGGFTSSGRQQLGTSRLSAVPEDCLTVAAWDQEGPMLVGLVPLRSEVGGIGARGSIHSPVRVVGHRCLSSSVMGAVARSSSGGLPTHSTDGVISLSDVRGASEEVSERSHTDLRAVPKVSPKRAKAFLMSFLFALGLASAGPWRGPFLVVWGHPTGTVQGRCGIGTLGAITGLCSFQCRAEG